MQIRVFAICFVILLGATLFLGCDNGDSSPASDSVNGRNKLDLTIGEKWRYEFSMNDEPYGFNDYEVVATTDLNDEKTFTVSSKLDLQESDACKPTTASGTLQVTQTDAPVSYQMDITISEG